MVIVTSKGFLKYYHQNHSKSPPVELQTSSTCWRCKTTVFPTKQQQHRQQQQHHHHHQQQHKACQNSQRLCSQSLSCWAAFVQCLPLSSFVHNPSPPHSGHLAFQLEVTRLPASETPDLTHPSSCLDETFSSFLSLVLRFLLVPLWCFWMFCFFALMILFFCFDAFLLYLGFENSHKWDLSDFIQLLWMVFYGDISHLLCLWFGGFRSVGVTCV